MSLGKWQGPTLGVWAQVELDKSTWQVVLVKLTCYPRLRPLFKSLDKWQLVKSTCQVNLHGDTPKITPVSCPKNSPRGVLSGRSGQGQAQKKVKISHFLIFFAQIFFGHTQKGPTNTFSDAIAIRTWQILLAVCVALFYRWQVPLDKLVNLTSWIDKLTCHLALLPLFKSLYKL